MDYLSTEQVAECWGLSPRSVRNYCVQGRIPGAILLGKTWAIPSDAERPGRANARARQEPALLVRLREEKEGRHPGGIYHRVQVQLTYNSNHIEGSTLSLDQTRLIFETSTIGAEDSGIRVDDIVEAVNHFRCIDYMIDHANDVVSEHLIKELYRLLKTSTTDADKDWFAVGDYKRLPNEVGGCETIAPEDVMKEMQTLIADYESDDQHSLEDIVAFHVAFERIHPFQDGNGRVGRLLMFKECLRNRIVPFVIADEMKLYYYRGRSKWDEEHGWLLETCAASQDTFKEWLDYFRIPYNADGTLRTE